MKIDSVSMGIFSLRIKNDKLNKIKNNFMKGVR